MGALGRCFQLTTLFCLALAGFAGLSILRYLPASLPDNVGPPDLTTASEQRKITPRPASGSILNPLPTQGELKDGPAATGEPTKASEHRARMCYTILASGGIEVDRVLRLLPLIYAPDAFYTIHLDLKSPRAARERLRSGIAAYGDNVLLLEPAMPVSWGGLSVLLAALFGLARSTQLWSGWDYWANLSASDMPLLTQEEISRVLGAQMMRNASFISGERHVGDWDEKTQGRRPPRTRFFFEDKRLYRIPEKPVAPNEAIYALGKAERTWNAANLAYRDDPEHFPVYKGDFWVVLHRSLADYIAKAPDNTARLLLAYCASLQVPDELYFQTVACHPRRPVGMPVFATSLRSIPPFHSGPHPVAWTPEGVRDAIDSGKLFSRKFRAEVAEDAMHIRAIKSALEAAAADPAVSDDRVQRALRFIAEKGPLCAAAAAREGEGEEFGGNDPAAIGFVERVSEPMYSTTSMEPV